MTSRKDVEQIKTVTIKQSDLRSLITQQGTYDIRYRIVAEDGVPVSNWTPTISIVAPTITQSNSNLKVASLGDNGFSMSFVKKYEFPAYDVFMYFVPSINFTVSPFTSTLRNRPTSTTAIYYTTVPHFLKPNMRVAIASANASYVTANALVTAANATSFTISGGLNTTVSATNVTADGSLTTIATNAAAISNSECFFFDRFYDAPGSTTFFTNFDAKDVYVIRTAANVVTDMVFDPKESTANLLSNLISTGSVVKYTIPNTAANNCVYLTLQPGTVPQKENKKPEIITSPNMILGQKVTLA